MKQALHLKIGQHLTMTPQLQQAIRLLQLSTLDLQQEIQQALDSNPLLEVSDDESDTTEALVDQTYEDKETAALNSNSETSDNSNEDTGADTDWNESIPDDLPTDSNWEDTFQSQGPGSGSAAEGDWPNQDNDTREDTLQDHLIWQLNLTPMSEQDYMVAEAIIDATDADGYLRSDLAELLEQFQAQQPELFMEADEDEILAVLHRVQQFDPPGVAARDLSECLCIQIRQLPETIEWREQAIRLCREFLPLLGSHDYKTLMRKMRLNDVELDNVINLIRSLNPKPGALISSTQSEYVIPDVMVRKIQDEWIVSLNPDIAPKLRINSQYADLIRRADSSADNTYLKNHLQEARWFLKSLLSRNDTLLKVATEIVERQRDFLDTGDEAMKPMVLHDIAEAVSMHESTISRVTTQKFIHTPRGIFELKYFFSSQVNTADGEGASSTAIRALIKKLISAENTAKPLSDNKIAQLLKEQGINVARRTVAKYREALSIPPSNERKRLL
ncbi:RNA polymerase factor sigma-54 [Nitrincola sp.]|uniref:RNA polymerase factor sigma-54 n=1 Tax=Nitrincola sp. TaxID=1926584 RepID=UPI003A951744